MLTLGIQPERRKKAPFAFDVSLQLVPEMTANHRFGGLHHLWKRQNVSGSATTMFLPLWVVVVFTATVTADDDEPFIVYTNGATSERNLPLCAGPREACNVVRQRFWQSSIVYRKCKCPDRGTSCPIQFTSLSDKRTIAFHARAQMKFCSRVGELEPCRHSAVAAGIRWNGTIHIYCFCGHHHFYQKFYTNSTGQYYRCTQYESCQQGDFCGHIAAHSYETYHVCTCPRRHICILQDRNKVHADEFLYRGQAYRGVCAPRK